LLVGTDLRTTVKPSFDIGQVTLLPVVVVPNVVVPKVVVENVVVPSVVVGGLIVIVGGVVTTPTVLVVEGAVETTGMDVAGSLDFPSSVAASAITAPETRATSRSAARAAQSQIGESRRQTSA
jgi:hypothetical protein